MRISLFSRNYLAQVIFYVILLYVIGAAAVLLLAADLVPYVPRLELSPQMLILFSVISLGLTTLVSAYHLMTMIRRRKRKTDRR